MANDNLPSFADMSEQEQMAVIEIAGRLVSYLNSLSTSEKNAALAGAYQELRGPLSAIAAQDDTEYPIFFIGVAMAAVAVDKKVTFTEKKAIKEICDIIGIPYDSSFFNDQFKSIVENNESGAGYLMHVSARLSGEVRAKFLTFIAIICAYDREITQLELSLLVGILAP